MLSTAKIVGNIERELRALVASMDEGATRLMGLHPDAGLTVRKVPERFVLQAGDIGVSISLFRSRAGMDAGAEVVLAVWQGEVTFPGRAPRDGHRATQLKTQQFRIVSYDDASWLWLDEATSGTMTSQALATTCIGAMAERLQPATVPAQ